MKRASESRLAWNTITALILISISGFAMDIFIPSLPEMAKELRTSPSAIQLTLSIFITSYGISQLLVGSILDSLGRYWPNLFSLLLFSAASFVIAYSDSLQTIYLMRILQGLAVAVIVVSKRAFFVDSFSGDELKKYTSLFTVIWAVGPIVAPFLGGVFQTHLGWRFNFLFLGYFGIVFFLIECFIGKESLKYRHPFRLPTIAKTYWEMIRSTDFTSGLLILGLCYAMLLTYGMASPFLIENHLHYSPDVTGYCSLCSGLSVLGGSFLARLLIKNSFVKKVLTAGLLQITIVGVLISVTSFTDNLFTLLAYVFMINSLTAFIFNTIFSYCIIRFPQHAGKTSGLVGGGFAIITSIFSSVLVNVITITSQAMLGVAYGILISCIVLIFIFSPFGSSRKKETLVTSSVKI